LEEDFGFHAACRPETNISRSPVENETGKPAFAQMIGDDNTALVRGANELHLHLAADIDLNVGSCEPNAS
jgi:hypothetical protein